jgi:hypothetical protein
MCLYDMAVGRRGVGRKTYQFFDQGGERDEVLLDSEVELVLVFEVDGDCWRFVSAVYNWCIETADLGEHGKHTLQHLAHLVNLQKPSALDLALAIVVLSAEPGPEKGAKDLQCYELARRV